MPGIAYKNKNATYPCVRQIPLPDKNTGDQGIPRHKRKYEGILTRNMNATHRCAPQSDFKVKKSTEVGIPTKKLMQWDSQTKHERQISLCT